MVSVLLLLGKQQKLSPPVETPTLEAAIQRQPVNLQWKTEYVPPELGPRHKLSYPQWLDILKQEAKIAAKKKPQNLTILAGDSLSLWFPPELLPEDRNWLNQGISGEVSNGLLQRLDIFDNTQPATILVMVGINDLIRGISDEEILNNYQQIITYLQKKHPQSQIIIQSILPHGAEQVTWEGKNKLLAVPNSRIRSLNKELEKIAMQQKVKYLNLHPLFTNKKGDMRREFSSDGLHLSPPGYLIWRTALQMYI
jgi:lysophospholipase L1-like esterase